VRILTPDKDLGQCLCGDRVVQVDRRQKKVTSEGAFRAERGFGPTSMPDFAFDGPRRILADRCDAKLGHGLIGLRSRPRWDKRAISELAQCHLALALEATVR
jgi:hypothetical protein